MEWVKLGDLADIKSGGTPRRSKKEYWNNANIPWVKISDFNDKFLSETEEFINENGLQNSSAKLFKAGTILYSIFATIGEATILKIDASTNQAIAGIEVNENLALKEYVYYYLLSIKNSVISQSRGVAQNNINLSIIKNFDIPLPSKKIQKLTINNLSLVEKLIQTRQDQIQALDDLVESLYYEFVFTNSEDYQKVKLDDIAIVRSSSRVFKKDLIDEGIPFYRGQEISMLSKNIEFEPEFYISEELYNSMKEKSGIPKKGDLLLPSIANEGQLWVVDTDKEFYFKDGRVLWINLDGNKEVNSIYLRYYLKYKLIQEFDSISSGSTFAELKIFILKDIDVLLPPIETQNQFAAFVEKIEKQKQILNDSLGDLTNLFDSLMQDAFDGSMTM